MRAVKRIYQLSFWIILDLWLIYMSTWRYFISLYVTLKKTMWRKIYRYMLKVYRVWKLEIQIQGFHNRMVTFQLSKTLVALNLRTQGGTTASGTSMIIVNTYYKTSVLITTLIVLNKPEYCVFISTYFQIKKNQSVWCFNFAVIF